MSKKGSAFAVCVGHGVLTAVACMVLTFSPAAGAAEAPRVDKGDATAITDTTALVRFKMAPGDGKNLSVVVFYGREDGETTEDAWAAKSGEAQRDKTAGPKTTGPEDYTARLENLEPETTYFYRIRATTSAGPTWSNVGELKTAPLGTPWYIGLAILLGVLAVIFVPFLGGTWFANRLRMPDHGWKLGLVLSSLVCGIAVMVVGWPPSLGIDLSGGVILVYELEESAGTQTKKTATEKEEAKAEDEGKTKKQKAAEKQVDMDKLLGAIMLRINPAGTRELTLRKYGPRQIEITIPRADDEQVRRIEKKVSQAGTLEFRILANNRDHKAQIALAQQTEADTVVDAEGAPVAWWVPVRKGREDSFATYTKIATRVAKDRGKETMEILVVKDPFDVTGEYLKHCTPGVDQSGRSCVNFTFTSRGGQLFGGLTGANTPDKVQEFTRKLGIILDGYLYSAPSIQSTIHDRGEITGSFTEQEVTDLVDVLNAGSLPTALKKDPISRLSIGPTLGRDTIERSSYAVLLSVLVVFAFMIVYYRFSGVVACAAVVMNLIMLVAIMIAIHADFTLPGIAGLALTVGMAVDANVLIYERMREELARDAALRMAIRNGFSRATSAIVDSNLTTLIAAAILYIIGTEQIKGFAVTLFLGVVLSMYTAVFCARVVFDIGERQGWITKLKMMQMIHNPRFNFVGMRNAGIAFSAAVILIGLAAVFARGRGLLDIDFTGGEALEVVFREPQDIADVRKSLEDLPDLTINDVEIQGEPRFTRFMINTSRTVDEADPANKGKTASAIVEAHIQKVFGDRLETNTLQVAGVTPIAAPAPAEKTPEPKPPAEKAPAEKAAPEKAAPEKSPAEKASEEKKPAAPDQSRLDLPPASLLASTDRGRGALGPSRSGQSSGSETGCQGRRSSGKAGGKTGRKGPGDPGQDACRSLRRRNPRRVDV